ncbi:MAG: cysteine hydrolase [Pseudonocardiaceae bacterium]
MTARRPTWCPLAPQPPFGSERRLVRCLECACYGKIEAVLIDPQRAAVLALHWQVNVIKPEGFFGPMLSEPVARSGVVERAARFHGLARGAGMPVVFTRFTVPIGEGGLVRNTAFMRAVGDAQEAFRPDAVGAQLIAEISAGIECDHVVDNQKLSGLAGNDLPHWLAERRVDTVFVTGVATNITVEQTARHGTDLGLTVHPVSDCVTAATDAVHCASLANLNLTTAGCLTAEQAFELLR